MKKFSFSKNNPFWRGKSNPALFSAKFCQGVLFEINTGNPVPSDSAIACPKFSPKVGRKNRSYSLKTVLNSKGDLEPKKLIEIFSGQVFAATLHFYP